MYLDTPYTLTEGRVLFEIARRPAVEVSWLRRELDIDAGYLSRVLSRFAADALVTRHRSEADARRQEIRATDAGRAAMAELDRRAARQIGVLLRGADCGALLDAMRVITQVLGRPAEADPPRAVTLRPLGPGDLGWVLQRHGTVYAAEFGWDASFEALCAGIIAEYTTRRAAAPGRTTGWIAEVDGRPAGSVFCVPDSVTTARLRLLLVEPWARGLGIGARLVGECCRFARGAGYTGITLWTYDRLAAARRIYTAAGFTLVSAEPDDAFGQQMMSQTWSRPL
jgi:DNA-binding MarR family transcriptional regulator/GNAT superfamily N-acetyltransferase